MDPREKDSEKKAINKNHAANSQDQDAPHQVQETSASTEKEYFPDSEDEKLSNSGNNTMDQRDLKETLEIDDDQLEDQKEDNIN